MYLLINLDQLKIVAKGQYQNLDNLALAEFPEDSYLIGPIDRKSTFESFSFDELSTLHRNLTNNGGGFTQWDIVSKLLELADKVPMHGTPPSPKALYIPPIPAVPPLPAGVQPWLQMPVEKPIAPPMPTAPSESVRPKAGTSTGRIWDIADRLLKENPLNLPISELKNYVVEIASQEGINPSTAQVQFGKWKKHQSGLK